jgi:DNA-binding response OmpR family regulator
MLPHPTAKSVSTRPVALNVEDDPGCSEVLAAIVAEAGYLPLLASTILDARRILERGPVAVLLLDLGLPGERGRYLLDDLAGFRTVPPTVIVSGSPEAPSVAAEFAVPLVGKPFDVEGLITTIHVAATFQTRPVRVGRSASGQRLAVVVDERDEPSSSQRKG